MAFRDLSEIVKGAEPKALPINGELVEFPANVSAKVGVMLSSVFDAVQDPDVDVADQEALNDYLGWSDEDAAEMELELLGPDGADTLSDLGVIGEARMRVIATLVFWHIAGQDVAEAVWEGKAPAPNRATRRAAAGRSPRTAGGAGSRTATAGSGSSVRRKTTRSAGARPGAGSAKTGS